MRSTVRNAGAAKTADRTTSAILLTLSRLSVRDIAAPPKLGRFGTLSKIDDDVAGEGHEPASARHEAVDAVRPAWWAGFIHLGT
ncbi:hypothetical protein M8542_33635 [Amycolatopsis sp. OK19-0408]|uniref:Uncharacterized protein n=1 Tax=Amycolatopsis iheyensis TaxID=2945988 RepID=A0A9X2SMM4_9PSEU|nr:hypothetical protein [Amycolatopsis iheyensis]MCR6487779.1 hypothetical protein [Amycolatopsis iheyensis]